MSEFGRHADLIEKGPRKVRDAAYWKMPVGTPITAAMKAAKKKEIKGQAPRVKQQRGGKQDRLNGYNRRINDIMLADKDSDSLAEDLGKVIADLSEESELSDDVVDDLFDRLEQIGRGEKDPGTVVDQDQGPDTRAQELGLQKPPKTPKPVAEQAAAAKPQKTTPPKKVAGALASAKAAFVAHVESKNTHQRKQAAWQQNIDAIAAADDTHEVGMAAKRAQIDASKHKYDAAEKQAIARLITQRNGFFLIRERIKSRKDESELDVLMAEAVKFKNDPRGGFQDQDWKDIRDGMAARRKEMRENPNKGNRFGRMQRAQTPDDAMSDLDMNDIRDLRPKDQQVGDPKVDLDIFKPEARVLAEAIGNVNERDALQPIMDELMVDAGKATSRRFTDGEFDELLDVLAKRDKELSNAAKRKANFRGAQNGSPTRHAADNRGSVQKAHYAHFADGKGSIGDAPEAGLWNFVRDNDQRFEVKPNGDRGISDNFWVKDKVSGERWMFKKAAFSDKDIFAEDMSNKFMALSGFSSTPTKRASYNPPGGTEVWMAQRDYSQVDGNAKVIPNANRKLGNGDPSVIDGLRKGSDPGGLVRMMVFDYIVNNGADRHSGNFMVRDEGGGRQKVAIIDQGLAFDTIGRYRPDKTTSFASFFGGYRANQWNIASHAGNVARGRDELAQHVDDAVTGFDKVDLDELRTYMLRDSTEMTPEQEQWVENWLGEMKWRIGQAKATKSDIATLIINFGGMK